MAYEIRPPAGEPAPVRVSPTMIDVEWNHFDFGWIPFSASSQDNEPHGVAIYHQAAAMLEE